MVTCKAASGEGAAPQTVGTARKPLQPLRVVEAGHRLLLGTASSAGAAGAAWAAGAARAARAAGAGGEVGDRAMR